MTNATKFQDLEKEVLELPPEYQFKLIEKIARELGKVNNLNKDHNSRKDLEIVAAKLRDHYFTDVELTAFTALDHEDFHAER